MKNPFEILKKKFEEAAAKGLSVAEYYGDEPCIDNEKMRDNWLYQYQINAIMKNFKYTKKLKIGDVYDTWAMHDHLENDSCRISKEDRDLDWGTYVLFGNINNPAEVIKNIEDFAKWHEYNYPEVKEKYKGLTLVEKLKKDQEVKGRRK